MSAFYKGRTLNIETRISVVFIACAFAAAILHPAHASSSIAIVAAVTMFSVIKFFDRKKNDEVESFKKDLAELRDKVDNIRLAQGLKR